MRKRIFVFSINLLVVASALCAGCATSDVDPAPRMIAQMDAAPADKRPPNWEVTKARMARRAPQFGEIAPEFTLPLLGGAGTITRSQCHRDKPLVLIFGSFT